MNTYILIIIITCVLPALTWHAGVEKLFVFFVRW